MLVAAWDGRCCSFWPGVPSASEPASVLGGMSFMRNVPLCPHDQQPRVVVVVGPVDSAWRILVFLSGERGGGEVFIFIEEPNRLLLDKDEGSPY